MCVKDREDGKQIMYIIKVGVIYLTITTLINPSLFMSDLELIKNNQSYHEKIISSISNQKLNTFKDYHNRGLNVQTGNVNDDSSSIHLINKLRGGAGNLSKNTDQEKINETLKESVKFDKLQKNLVSKSAEDSKSFKSFTDKSFNKIVIGIMDKMEPVIGNQNFWRVLAETQKPVKSELSISVKSSSKEDPKPPKISAKKSSSIFVEASVPINFHRWPAFAAGSAMASEMPEIKDKLQTPLANLQVAKEYLETSQSDNQWRYRFWKLIKDTTVINIAIETSGDIGAFGAGAASNKVADGYMNEMVFTEATKTQQEKLNLEMFKQIAREQNIDVSEVRGTGLMREFVPDFMQKDICERPKQDSRPNSWEDPTYSDNDPSYFN